MKKALIIIAVIIATPALIYFGAGLVSFIEGENLSNKTKATETVYVFRFENSREVTIKDPFSRITRSWGGSPISFEIENGVRIITFEDGAILKTSNDSIEPQSTYVHLKGYMGVYSTNTNFTVNESGKIDDDSWHGG
jgi:hypothetical protein